VTEEMREEIKELLEFNENTTYHNQRETEKALLSGKFISISTYI
jgi:hypothetical protein